MKTFAGIEEKYSNYESSNIILQSIPYDKTSTWGKGADKGFKAFIEASQNMELYDIELDCEIYKNGIFIPEQLSVNYTPEKMYNIIYNNTKKLLETDKFLTFFGGEHSISIGIIKAFYEKYDNFSVLQLDAHTDLRPEYNGSKFNHACALHDANLNSQVIQIGIRSMDISEKKFLKKDNCFFAKDIYDNNKWMNDSIEKLNKNVYITIDLDVFDPSIMPSTGTPEPGGLLWYQVISYLKEVFIHKNVVGFDIVELAPIVKLNAPNFLVAKLYYKLLGYKYYEKRTY